MVGGGFISGSTITYDNLATFQRATFTGAFFTTPFIQLNANSQVVGDLGVTGALSKGSGTFKITHPLNSEKWLYHSFIEGPKADLIYRGKATITSGSSTVNIDTSSNMTEGTFVLLTQDPQIFLQNNSTWDKIKGSINGNLLNIISENTTDSFEIEWMVIAERADETIKKWNLTDENGHLIPEHNK